MILIAFGSIECNGFVAMVKFTSVFWLFFMLSGLSLFVLRRKEPSRLRPFKVPAYPLLPLVFVVTCAIRALPTRNRPTPVILRWL